MTGSKKIFFKRHKKMKRNRQLILRFKNQRGATAVVVAIVISVLIGFVALAVDIGYLAATKNELQNVADSAALAGAGLLGEIYTGMSYEEQQSYDCETDDTIADSYSSDRLSIKAQAKDVVGTALKNRVAGKTDMSINDADIIIYNLKASDNNTKYPGPDVTSTPTAVRVIARRDDSANGPITTFFARIFGIDTSDVRADAVASLSGQGTIGEGEIELPIGISTEWFNLHDDDDGYCGDHIAFSPPTDPDACGGWTGWDIGHNDNLLGDILNNSNESDVDSSFDNPEATAGLTDFDFSNGKLSQQTFYALQALFQIKGYDVTPPDTNELQVPACGTDDGNPIIPCYKPDQWNDEIIAAHGQGNPAPQIDSKTGDPALYPGIFEDSLRYEHRWQTTVVVYEDDDCVPNEFLTIVGFVEVELTHVGDASDKVVYGNIKCEYVEGPSQGGGGDFGKYGSIPKLVE